MQATVSGVKSLVQMNPHFDIKLDLEASSIQRRCSFPLPMIVLLALSNLVQVIVKCRSHLRCNDFWVFEPGIMSNMSLGITVARFAQTDESSQLLLKFPLPSSMAEDPNASGKEQRCEHLIRMYPLNE